VKAYKLLIIIASRRIAFRLA